MRPGPSLRSGRQRGPFQPFLSPPTFPACPSASPSSRSASCSSRASCCPSTSSSRATAACSRTRRRRANGSACCCPASGARRRPRARSGTIAEMRATQPLAEGRSNIVVQGGQRFMVSRYVDDEAPYLVAMVEPFEDRDDTPVTCQRPRRADGGVPALRPGPSRPARHRARRRARCPPRPPALSFRVAGGMELDLAEQQACSSCAPRRARVERLLELLPPLSSAIEPGAAVHRSARQNGKGHHPPDLTAGA